MKSHVLIAGATGYLGGHLVKAFYKEGYEVSVVVRNVNKLGDLMPYIHHIHEADLGSQEALVPLMKGIDLLVSSVGITRQKDGLTYMSVDYQMNLNLMQAGLLQGVPKMMYVSVLNAHKVPELDIIKAKEKFVSALEASSMTSIIIRPSGFFSDMSEVFHMAQKGRGYVAGEGNFVVNPIHGQDLGAFCVSHADAPSGQYPVGGPDTLTQSELFNLAFDALNKPAKLTHIPLVVMKMIKSIIRTFTTKTFQGPIIFFLTTLTMDMGGPEYGEIHLKDFFKQMAQDEK